jgi:Xaa-Pro dipeptidase
MNSKRLENLRRQMPMYQMDGVALVPGPNLVYFSGIHAHLSERPIVLFIPAEGLPAIIIPTLEAMKAREAGIPEERIFAWSDNVWCEGAFERIAYELGLSGWNLGVETLYMRVLESQHLFACATGLELSPADPLINTLRGVKDAEEIASMQKAVSVAEEAMNSLLPDIRIGMSEKQIAGMLTLKLMDAGADSISFDPIVASGPNSAIPHAVPTDRQIQEGDLLLFDWGAMIDGYASDLTRTFALGEIEPEMKEIYDVVRLANKAAKAVVLPGASAQDVDRAARIVIDKAGYGRFFFHRTGHGLGLEVHEEPSLKEGNLQQLRLGNVFTIEPGIYLEGRGGVRIEDNILVTEDGHQSLSSFPRELISLGISI